MRHTWNKDYEFDPQYERSRTCTRCGIVRTRLGVGRDSYYSWVKPDGTRGDTLRGKYGDPFPHCETKEDDN